MMFEATLPSERVKELLAEASGNFASSIKAYAYLLIEEGTEKLCVGSNGYQKEDLIALLNRAIAQVEADDSEYPQCGEPRLVQLPGSGTVINGDPE